MSIKARYCGSDTTALSDFTSISEQLFIFSFTQARLTLFFDFQGKKKWRCTKDAPFVLALWWSYIPLSDSFFLPMPQGPTCKSKVSNGSGRSCSSSQGYYMSSWSTGIGRPQRTPRTWVTVYFFFHLYSDYTFCLHLLSRPYACVYTTSLRLKWICPYASRFTRWCRTLRVSDDALFLSDYSCLFSCLLGRVIKVMMVNLLLCLTLFSTYASRGPTVRPAFSRKWWWCIYLSLSLFSCFLVYAHLISQVYPR